MSTNLRFSINFKFISNSTFEFQLNSNFISFAELKKKFLGGEGRRGGGGGGGQSLKGGMGNF